VNLPAAATQSLPASTAGHLEPRICMLRRLYYWIAILHAAQTQTAFESIVHGSLLPAAFVKPSAEQYHETQ